MQPLQHHQGPQAIRDFTRAMRGDVGNMPPLMIRAVTRDTARAVLGECQFQTGGGVTFSFCALLRALA